MAFTLLLCSRAAPLLHLSRIDGLFLTVYVTKAKTDKSRNIWSEFRLIICGLNFIIERSVIVKQESPIKLFSLLLAINDLLILNEKSFCEFTTVLIPVDWTQYLQE